MYWDIFTVIYLVLCKVVTLELREETRFCYASTIENPDQNSRVELMIFIPGSWFWKGIIHVC